MTNEQIFLLALDKLTYGTFDVENLSGPEHTKSRKMMVYLITGHATSYSLLDLQNAINQHFNVGGIAEDAKRSFLAALCRKAMDVKKEEA